MPGLMSGIEKSINANVTDMFNSASNILADDIYSYNGENFDGYQWIAALDKKTCLICAELDNQIFDLLPGMPGTGTEPPGIPPIHAHCLLGNTLISTCSDISNVSRRAYQGEIIIIRTASGKSIRCTPNHPILCDTGFVRAKDIKKNHNLVCNNGLKTIPIGKSKNNRESRIEDIFSSFMKYGVMMSRTMKVSSEDFHGDVTNKEVEIVWANRILTNKVNPIISKCAGKKSLIFRILKRLIGIACPRSLAFFFKSMFASFTCKVRIFCQKLDLFFSSVLHSFNLLISAASHGNIVFLKKSYHVSPCKSKLIGDSGNPCTGIIQCKNIRFRRRDNISISIGSDRSPFEDVVNDVFGNTELSRDILNRYSGQITFDHVVAVDSMIAFTHVYNLETKDNWYIANGIINHNCRCVMAPVLKGMRDHPTQTAINYKDWFDRQSDEVKLDILGPSRFKLYKNGMSVTEFARDGRVLTLKELSTERITRKEILSALQQKESIKRDRSQPLTIEQKNAYKDYLINQLSGMEGRSDAQITEWADAIMVRFDRLPLKLQHLFFENQITISSKTNQGNRAYFVPITNTIHLHKSRISTSQRNLDTFFHEMGHAIDFRHGIGGSFASALLPLRADFNAFLEKAQRQGGLSPERINQRLRGYSRGDISDLFRGLSKGQFTGNFGHSLDYYRKRGRIQMEAFAHIVSSFQSNSRRHFKEFFPTSFSYFMEWLDKLDT